jgi:tetratricopeptide (TPR) repeat protein
VDRLEQEQKWPEALAVARRAEAALAGGDGNPQSQGRVWQTLDVLELLSRLEEIRGSSPWQGGSPSATPRLIGSGETARLYSAAFRDHGVNVEELSPAEAATRLGSSTAIAVPLAAALDDWAMRSQDAGDTRQASQLLTLAGAVDPDPWRSQVRSAAAARDNAALLQLAEAKDADGQPPQSFVMLADRLPREQKLALLKRASHKHPSDFWIRLELTRVCSLLKDTDGTRHADVVRALRPLSSASWHNFSLALHNDGKLDEAILAAKKALEIYPNRPGTLLILGDALKDHGKLDEAVAAYRKAIELDPKHDGAHINLGVALRGQGKVDEAVAAYRKAIELDPKLDLAHVNLGGVLQEQGKLTEAIAELGEAIRLKKDNALAHYNLGCALGDRGQPEGAIAEYQEAIRIEKDYAEAHCNLGLILRHKGQFREALEELRRGHELGSRRPGWRYPSLQWVRQCERLVELDGRLPDILAGKTAPASPDERIALAGLCSNKRLHHAAVRFFEEAFTAKPALAVSPGAFHRYNAACAAALAGCGKAKDADKLEGKERARLRRQALDWLRADLEAWRRRLDKEPDMVRPIIVEKMRHWLADTDFTGVRGPAALARLPVAERLAWQELWSGVADTLARVTTKTAPEMKSGAK